jgi:hypothetical protein
MSLDRRNTTSETGEMVKDGRGRIRSENTEGNKEQIKGNGQLFKKSHSVANVNLRKGKTLSSQSGSMDDDEKRNANDKKIPGSGSVNDKKLPSSGAANDKNLASSENENDTNLSSSGVENGKKSPSSGNANDKKSPVLKNRRLETLPVRHPWPVKN